MTEAQHRLVAYLARVGKRQSYWQCFHDAPLNRQALSFTERNFDRTVSALIAASVVAIDGDDIVLLAGVR